MNDTSTSYLKRLTGIVFFVLVAWIIVSFLYAPMYAIFSKIFFSNGQFSLSTFATVFRSKRVTSSLINTLIMGLCTVIIVNVIGVFQIAVTEIFKIKFSRVLNLVFFLPVIYGSVAAVTAYLAVYGGRGIVTKVILNYFPHFNRSWFSGFLGVFLLHAFTMTTYHIIFVKNAARGIDNHIIEAGRSMGANVSTLFFRIIVPMLKPAIFAATLLLLIGALSSNAAPRLVGTRGGSNFQMINSMIQTLNSLQRQDMAALLALLLGAASFIVLLSFKRIESRGHYSSLQSVKGSLSRIEIKSKSVNIIVHAIAYLLFLIILAPVLVTVLFSFTPSSVVINDTFPNSFTFDNYIRVFSSARYLRPLINSLIIAAVATGLALFVALISVVLIRKSPKILGSILELSFFIPWFLPGSMLAVGLILAYSRPNVLVMNKVLLGTYFLLPIAYVIFKLPFAIRMLNATMMSINQSLEEAARSLGAGVLYTYWKVILPLILPTILSIAALSFNSLLAEYTISNLLYGVGNYPLGVALGAGTMSNDPNLVTNALVYLVVLMVISFSTIMITNKINEKRKY